MITREADGTILTHADLRLALPQPRPFGADDRALLVCVVYWAVRGTLTPEESKQHAQQLAELPVKMETCSTKRTPLKTWRKNSSAAPIFFISAAASTSLSLWKAR